MPSARSDSLLPDRITVSPESAVSPFRPARKRRILLQPLGRATGSDVRIALVPRYCVAHVRVPGTLEQLGMLYFLDY